MKSRFILLLSALVLMTSSFSCGDSSGSESRNAPAASGDSLVGTLEEETTEGTTVRKVQRTTDNIEEELSELLSPDDIDSDDRIAVEELLNRFYELQNSHEGEELLKLMYSTAQIDKNKKSGVYQQELNGYNKGLTFDYFYYDESVSEIYGYKPLGEKALEGATRLLEVKADRGYSVGLEIYRLLYKDVVEEGYRWDDENAPKKRVTEEECYDTFFSVVHTETEGWKILKYHKDENELINVLSSSAFSITKASEAALTDLSAKGSKIGGTYIIHSDPSKNTSEVKLDTEFFYKMVKNYTLFADEPECEYFVVIKDADVKYAVVDPPQFHGKIEVYPAMKIYNPETDEYTDFDVDNVTSVDEIYDKVKEHIH